MRTGIFLAAVLVSSSPIIADDNMGTVIDSLSTLQYDSAGPFALGDTVSLDDLATPRSRCIAYDPDKDVKDDTSGAVSSRLTLYLIKDYSDLENEFKFSFSLKASMTAKFGDIGGGGSSSQSLNFERFVKNEKSSLLFVLEAAADQGRQYIAEYSIKDEFTPLLEAADKTEFIKKCGTHFIRSVSKKSNLRVVITVSNLNSSSKTAITSKFSSSGDAGGSVAGITASAKSELSTDLANTLNLASKLGKISYQVQSTGGAGIATLGKVLKGIDVTSATDIRTLLDAMADASADFTQANAAPSSFILIQHPELTADLVAFNPTRFVALGEIYKALLRVEEQVSVYEGYKRDNFVLWDKYFRIFQEEVSQLRSKILLRYDACRRQAQCEIDFPLSSQGLFLDDALYEGKTAADCPLGFSLDAKLNDVSVSTTNVLSSIVLSWWGRIRYVDQIDIDGLEIYRITPDLILERLPFSPSLQFRSGNSDEAGASAFITLNRTMLDSARIANAGDVDWGYLDDQRKEVARSLYFIRLRTVTGFSVDNVLGYPNMKGCKLAEEGL